MTQIKGMGTENVNLVDIQDVGIDSDHRKLNLYAHVLESLKSDEY